jgi:hypothetical protein
MNNPAATVGADGRLLTRTFIPLTSNSVTSAACSVMLSILPVWAAAAKAKTSTSGTTAENLRMDKFIFLKKPIIAVRLFNLIGADQVLIR